MKHICAQQQHYCSPTKPTFEKLINIEKLNIFSEKTNFWAWFIPTLLNKKLKLLRPFYKQDSDGQVCVCFFKLLPSSPTAKILLLLLASSTKSSFIILDWLNAQKSQTDVNLYTRICKSNQVLLVNACKRVTQIKLQILPLKWHYHKVCFIKWKLHLQIFSHISLNWSSKSLTFWDGLNT